LYVEFASVKGGRPEYEWTPAWILPGEGVAALLREAVRVERANRPESDYLREFAQLARDILTEHAPPAEIRRETGSLVEYTADGVEQPEVVVQVKEWTGNRYWEHGRQRWPLGVPLSEQTLKYLARTDKPLVTWVVWNGEVIDVLEAQGNRSVI
jgi:hypothetical protein